MRNKTLFFITTLALTIFSFGCGGNGANSTNTNVANTAGSNAANSNSPLATTKKAEGETTNNAPTIAPVVNAYYEALKKKDDAGLRNVLAQDFVRELESEAREEKKAGLADYILSMETVPEAPFEVRNERISGNKAVAELRGGTYKNWTPFEFINEGGKWKFTGGSPDLQTVDQSK
jgi:hypothetical protein